MGAKGPKRANELWFGAEPPPSLDLELASHRGADVVKCCLMLYQALYLVQGTSVEGHAIPVTRSSSTAHPLYRCCCEAVMSHRSRMVELRRPLSILSRNPQ
jgi:hypothetical protein